MPLVKLHHRRIMRLVDFPDVRDLPIIQKVELVDELWLSMTPELEVLDVSDCEKKLLDQRWEDFLEDPKSALTLDQFQQKMKAIRE